jgi:arylsulfatase A-like enzyme
LADDAIGWLHRHQAFEPDKPFFMYWATGCLHAPHHVFKEWADKYAGKFDDGWDAYRERVFARAKEKGWIPADAQLTPRDPQMPAWDEIPEEQRPFHRRLMEVAAGFAEHADVQAGRVIDEIERLGLAENTLVFYIWGDNGSSGEGQNGTISELLAQNGIPTTVAMHIKTLEEMGGLDLLGTPKVDNQYHAGWAWAGSTPYRGMKLLASDLGGTRNPMAVRCPAKIAPDATPRTQFHHCNDIVPTIYDVVGITPPLVVNGIPQDPIDGVSFAYTFDKPDAPGRLITQYFEIMGSRAIYHDGWMASATGPRLPWIPGLPPGIEDWTPDHDEWRLYNLEEDWTQANDLAAQMPDKLAQMKEMFAIEAARNSVYPIGGGLWIPVFHPELRISTPYREWNLGPDITRMPEFCAPALGNRPNLVTIDADLPENASGVLYALGSSERRSHRLPRRRVPLLRVQPVHHHADEDSLRAASPGRAGQHPHLDRIRRSQARRAAERHARRQRRSARLRDSACERTAVVHRQRLPGHRRVLRRTSLTGLLGPSAVPVQRHDHERQRPLHVLGQRSIASRGVSLGSPFPVPSGLTF